MSVNLTGVVGDLSSLVPSSSDILQQVIVGAGASVVLAGLKSNAGVEALDPLHIFHHPATETTPATTSTIVGKTVSASVFNSMSPASQAQLMAGGYSIVAG